MRDPIKSLHAHPIDRRLFGAFVDGGRSFVSVRGPAFGKRSSPPAVTYLDEVVTRTPLTQFTVAFHPIVDLNCDAIFAYQAVVCGQGDRNVPLVNQTSPSSRVMYEYQRRAISMAVDFQLMGRLCLSIRPDTALEIRYGIRRTIQEMQNLGLNERRLIFEFSENHAITDLRALGRFLAAFRNRGLLIAISNFGAGSNALNTVIDLRPEIVKLGSELVWKIERCNARQAVISCLVESFAKLKILIVAEGVSSVEQARMLRSLGVTLMQGELFAPPIARLTGPAGLR
ncbi:EAL domain-containing protein [Ensifer adhaerens]|uniref:EAL domain-containing protein n=1 Tax=Ensifer adhaerens TaxID=106592 RepID=UPI00385171F5